MKKKYAERKDRDQIELGTELAPKFDEHGLIPCVTVDNRSGDVLMFAWMNEEALTLTLDSGTATYYSRSREKIWVKGETSGRHQKVQKMLVDCDQDVIQLRVDVEGDGTCHRGYRTCFYRAVSGDDSTRLFFVEDRPVFDPEDVYGNH
ncbi:MAG: phosphoribosyl-AMP cyclohydrolase [Balneolaceae bacterium]